jgi:hypothetical protein
MPFLLLLLSHRRLAKAFSVRHWDLIVLLLDYDPPRNVRHLLK